MLIEYYNNKELAYTNRKRYHSFSFTPFYKETQKSVLLGDGANTSIKTKKDNICNYVKIDDTRWYVTSYVYLNGGQVQLNLQRDVIGEFGIGDCYGKIERGYTDNFLKYRKELSLNQILKERKKLIPMNSKYGNYNVSTHDNEMWGIMYLVNPTEDGESKVNINIPDFNPFEVVNIDYIENNTSQLIKIENIDNGVSISFIVQYGLMNARFKILIDFKYNFRNRVWEHYVYVDKIEDNTNDTVYFVDIEKYGVIGFDSPISFTDENYIEISAAIGVLLAKGILSESNSGTFMFPEIGDTVDATTNLNSFVINHDGKYLSYNVSTVEGYKFGTSPTFNIFYTNYIKKYIEDKEYKFNTTKRVLFGACSYFKGANDSFVVNNKIFCVNKIYNYTEISSIEAGTLTFDLTRNLIDEPFTIIAVPLFDVTITGTETYNIKKNSAFSVFNKVIQYLSGASPYLVDAQIYPYCPVLTSCGASLKDNNNNVVPFFTVNSSCYEHICEVNLLPSSDVKKEYIQRSYSIISPEQSGKFTFDFYDYVNTVYDNNGVNNASLYIKVKTALKPFSIISSAVISPEAESLYGLTYPSDLRGCQPSSNGFECSLASNAFQEYKRQNSNYQQIFALQKGELQKQHQVELVNEITGGIVNTTTAAAMGAIAGNAMADAGLLNAFGTKAVGAVAGGVSAGVVVGGAMTAQILANNGLREYEEGLQQQNFDLQIGTIKNLPNSINRISSFNEIIIKDFHYVVEIYECSNAEKQIVDNFISKYGYGIGVFDVLSKYQKDGWFLRSTLVSSNYNVNLHLIAEKELMGGIYLYEQI